MSCKFTKPSSVTVSVSCEKLVNRDLPSNESGWGIVEAVQTMAVSVSGSIICGMGFRSMFVTGLQKYRFLVGGGNSWLYFFGCSKVDG